MYPSGPSPLGSCGFPCSPLATQLNVFLHFEGRSSTHCNKKDLHLYSNGLYISMLYQLLHNSHTVIDDWLSSYKAELLLLLFVCDWKLIEPRKHIFSGKSLFYFHLESKYECFAPTGFL